MSISNTVTESIMTDALSKTDQSLGDWDNKATFTKGTDAFYALIATTNGSGSAWLLAQHKAQLGLKTIKSIFIFISVDPLDDDDLIKIESST